jgi:hypothetical protein
MPCSFFRAKDVKKKVAAVFRDAKTKAKKAMGTGGTYEVTTPAEQPTFANPLFEHSDEVVGKSFYHGSLLEGWLVRRDMLS